MFDKAKLEYRRCIANGFNPAMSFVIACPLYIWIPFWFLVGYASTELVKYLIS